MPTTPNYGLRFPTLGDTPDAPRDYQALAEDTDAALVTVDSNTSSPYAQTARVGTSEYPPGSMQNLDVTATLPVAPGGVYLVGWSLILANVGTAQSSGNVRITVNGSNVTLDGKHDLTDAGVMLSGAATYLHTAAGTDLTVVAWFQAGSGTIRVYEDSRVWLARIGTTV